MEFLARYNKEGKLEFATKSMGKLWNRITGFYVSTGSYFKITIEEPEKRTTEGQNKLFKRICIMVSKDTGNQYHDVEKEFLTLTPFTTKETLFGQQSERNKTLAELNTKEFQEFLENVLLMANEIMNCKLVMHNHETLGSILTIE